MNFSHQSLQLMFEVSCMFPGQCNKTWSTFSFRPIYLNVYRSNRDVRALVRVLLCLRFFKVAASGQRAQVRHGHVRLTLRHLPARRHAQEPSLGVVLRDSHALSVHLGHIHGLGLAPMVRNMYVYSTEGGGRGLRVYHSIECKVKPQQYQRFNGIQCARTFSLLQYRT